jgi:hypothetical protein
VSAKRTTLQRVHVMLKPMASFAKEYCTLLVKFPLLSMTNPYRSVGKEAPAPLAFGLQNGVRVSGRTSSISADAAPS